MGTTVVVVTWLYPMSQGALVLLVERLVVEVVTIRPHKMTCRHPTHQVSLDSMCALGGFQVHVVSYWEQYSSRAFCFHNLAFVDVSVGVAGPHDVFYH